MKEKLLKIGLFISLSVGNVLFPMFCGASEKTVDGQNDGNSELVITLDRLTGNKVSDKLLGFNIVGPTTPDSAWKSGKLAKGIAATRPAFLRFPGGTVNTYIHWDAPNGVGWSDNWNPEYDRKNDKDPSQYTDMDEYFEILKKTGASPLVGINCVSGFVYNRVEDGIDEALRLMKYCKDKGVEVKYWYLGNEMWAKGCNGGARTPAQYAEMINTFVPRMKAFDPDIKIVVDWRNPYKKFNEEYRELVTLAGDNIDVLDIHYYNTWGNASIEAWLATTPNGVFTGQTYTEDIRMIKKLFAECGHPEIELAALEWNVGPGKKNASGTPLQPGTCAMIQAEMMTQFMREGMYMACFWPLFWPEGNFTRRGFYNHATDTLYPSSEVLKCFGAFQGAELVETPLEVEDDILCIAVKTKKGPKLALINKTQNSRNVSLQGKFAGKSSKNIVSFTLDDRLNDLTMTEKKECKTIVLNPYSLTFID